MKILRKLLFLAVITVLVPAVALMAIAVSARFSDGPSVVFAGGPLIAGEMATGADPDWSFIRDVNTIELQLLAPPRSRLVWVAESEGKIYVVSGYMGTTIGRLWKRWPAQAERDGRAIIRVAGQRYERTLVRIIEGPVVEGVISDPSRKYGFGATSEDLREGTTWLFELAPPGTRSGASS